MRINQTKNTQNFGGLYNDKILLKGLEYVSSHGASVAAGVSLLGATVLRPLAINAVPRVDKEKKKTLTAESLSSALAKFAIVQTVALPIESAIKKIDKAPEQFLKSDTIKNLSAKDYKFLTQAIKLSSNLISAIPKSILGVSLVPIILDLISKNKKDEAKKQKEPSFTGLANVIGKIIDCDGVQKFATKHSVNDLNIARNMSVATDVLLTATSVVSVKKSKKIKEEQKTPLILNKLLSSAVSIFAGCEIDKLIKNGTKNMLEKFVEANKNSPKLPKYIEGINILRPTMVFALVYYGIIPILTTFATDKLSKNKE